RDAEFGGAIRIVVPAALGKLLFEDVIRGLGNARIVFAAEEGHEKDVFGFEDGVALKLADPVSVVHLSGKQHALRPLDGGLQGGNVRGVVPNAWNVGARSVR